MRIAFVGHSYHLKTGSSDFLLALLRRAGEVEAFFDESWLTGTHSGWAAELRPEQYDCVVVFQTPEPMLRLDARHPNLVFVPMLDGHFGDGRFWWREEFNAAKIVCFSAALDRELAALAPVRFFAQYFPSIDGLPALARPEELAGFFWYRKPQIDLAFLRQLTGRTRFDRFTVQRAPDPGTSAPPPSRRAPRARVFTEVEPWLADRASALARLAEHTVYFAPRLYEGIGMSFLEAMALGLCVVAPDTPTHNEYIAHGATGLLYSPTRPEPFDFGEFRELGRRARESAARRRELWLAAEAELLDFVCTPRERLAGGRTLVDFWRPSPAPRTVATPAPSSAPPAITVITVGGDATANLASTLASVAEQDHPAVEHLVLGGDPGRHSARSGVRFLALPRAAAGSGDYASMAAALAEARGEYVLFLASGDRLVSPQALRSLLESAPSDADVVYGHFVVRNARGVENLHLVAELGHTLARLDATGFDVRWIERVPTLQATAIRASLLARFGFDPALRFAADFDLLRRLVRSGARHHLVDQVVAVCGPESSWSRLLHLCGGEWLRIAGRHGGARGARSALTALGLDPIDAWECTLWGCLDRVRERRLQRFPLPAAASDDPPAATAERRLAGVLRVAARHVAAAERLLTLLRFAVKKNSPAPADEPLETYIASFADGLDFRRRGRASFLSRLAGISWPEEWGRWSDGPRIEIEFRRMLPRTARVELEAFAHPSLAGASVEVTIGSAVARIALDGEPFRVYVVDLETSGREQTLTLAIPLPPLPAQWEDEPHGERRRLGLALRRLCILDLDDSPGDRA